MLPPSARSERIRRSVPASPDSPFAVSPSRSRALLRSPAASEKSWPVRALARSAAPFVRVSAALPSVPAAWAACWKAACTVSGSRVREVRAPRRAFSPSPTAPAALPSPAARSSRDCRVSSRSVAWARFSRAVLARFKDAVRSARASSNCSRAADSAAGSRATRALPSVFRAPRSWERAVFPWDWACSSCVRASRRATAWGPERLSAPERSSFRALEMSSSISSPPAVRSARESRASAVASARSLTCWRLSSPQFAVRSSRSDAASAAVSV